MLAKSLRPPPDKFHGLQRRRDALPPARARPAWPTAEARDALRRARARSSRPCAATSTTPASSRSRRRCSSRSTAARWRGRSRPTTTRWTATLYLRIATELYLKRLIVGGLERVYEIGKDFRNEGISHKHNPEFTMVEWYEAYADYDGRDARAWRSVVAAVARRRRLRRRDRLRRRRGRASTLRDAIRERTGHRRHGAPRPRRARAPPSRRAELDCRPTTARGRSSSTTCCRSTSSRRSREPTFVVDYPVELSPFAKAHRSEPGLVERFEAFAGGMEIANAFTELNDPDEQRARFEAQARLAAEGDDEAQPYDEAFLRRSSTACRRPAASASASTGS